MVLVAPSILSADFLRLGEEVDALIHAGADYLHVDVMDGHFVPNLTIGPPVVKAIKERSTIPLDVHLMISNAEDTVDDYLKAGADQIIVHVEACTHPDRLIRYIKQKGARAGVSLNPDTHENAIEHLLPELDVVLVMSVNPGFSGQSFIQSTVSKIKAIRKMIDTLKIPCRLSVDGGINDETREHVVDAGATILVAGNYVLKSANYKKAIHFLKSGS